MIFYSRKLTSQHDDFSNYREVQVEMFDKMNGDGDVYLYLIGSVKYSYCCQPYDRKSEVCTSQPYIFDFNIIEEFRGNGFGKLLIEKTIELIKENTDIHYKNEIGVSTDFNNEVSNKIFNSFGFEEVSIVRSLKLDLRPDPFGNDNDDLAF